MKFFGILRIDSLGTRRSLLRQFSTKNVLLNHLKPQATFKPISNSIIGSKEPQISPINYNNELIRKVFDDETFWRKFNNDLNPSLASTFFKSIGKETGLFQNPLLVSPSGLRKFSKESLKRAQSVVHQITTDHSEHGLRNYITNLDRLSDILCRVIDLAEFIRVAHPNSSFLKAAQECHEEMFEFMNILNTNVELYQILRKVLTDPKVLDQLSYEEIKVGKILLADFEKSGINMDDETRSDFITLSQQISVVGQQYQNAVNNPGVNEILLTQSDLEGVDKNLIQSLERTKGYFSVPAYGYIPHALLTSCKKEETRRKLWIMIHSTSSKQVETLDFMLQLRYALANLLGKESFAAYQLDEKMAKTPENVNDFLLKLQNETKPHSIAELRVFADMKQRELGQYKELNDEEVADFLKPWDRDYYSNAYSASRRRQNYEQLSAYFSLGSVMQGLSNLFKEIYGIQLIPEKVLSGETWSADVRRINVVSDTEGVIGVVYCDLFERAGKTPNPAHFTVCCSRKIYADEDVEDLRLIQVGQSKLTNEKFQLPVISLVCNFGKNQNIGKCLLTLNDVETLFHEMGHAMHSMLGRTSLHNISGTRCSTDFVELPSILMEHFANDPRVIQTFARHYLTDEPIPSQLLKAVKAENNYLKHTETYSQIKMALLDQALHSEVASSRAFSSNNVYHNQELKSRIFADLESNWQAKFGHLYGYGASYYSYLFDRAIASKVWKHLFADNPLDRSNGEKFKDSVLKWGGSRDPWLCVCDALEIPELANGDSRAMEIIGDTEI
ncbi:hypothetical protein WICMUC_003779 [Wickerhamomyces mucosus]|uniref:Mitochondrial intermediate peptidase n=1 Tax=Wickerhamomyces mucosus TaxID=1378264 RepID=A0A9P8PL79_9ASCO|nr:hypothetical protein WICMUC_003779 [Wickerhamomyces mucosus]